MYFAIPIHLEGNVYAVYVCCTIYVYEYTYAVYVDKNMYLCACTGMYMEIGL